MVSIFNNTNTIGPVGGLALACLIIIGVANVLESELGISTGDLSGIAFLGFFACIAIVAYAVSQDS